MSETQKYKSTGKVYLTRKKKMSQMVNQRLNLEAMQLVFEKKQIL